MAGHDKFEWARSPADEGQRNSVSLSLEELTKEYGLTLKEYVQKRRQLGDLIRLKYQAARDPDIFDKIKLKDMEVHSRHEKLKLSGEALGKTEHDIVVDVLRQEGNLSEDLGLPEFCVLTSEDLTFENYVGDASRFIPKQGRVERNRPNERLFVRPSADTQFLKKDEVMIVFHMNLHVGKLMYDEYILKEPDRYAREKRRRAFAGAVNGRLLYLRDGPKFHYHTMSIHGVIIKKADLEKEAALIRENPEKFRLGDKFYSSEEIGQNEEEFRQSLREAFEPLEPYGKQNSIGEQMIEQIGDFYGPAAAAIARAEYENWRTKED